MRGRCVNQPICDRSPRHRPSVRLGLDFEDDHFSKNGTQRRARERGDMHKYAPITDVRGEESESAIVIPGGEDASDPSAIVTINHPTMLTGTAENRCRARWPSSRSAPPIPVIALNYRSGRHFSTSVGQ